MSQNRQIQDEIIRLLDSGMTDKQEIYTKVVENLHLPRPTVRRACRDLVNEMKRRIEILKPLWGDKVG